MEILSKAYWSAILSKLIETFISVKLWILVFASYIALKVFYIAEEMKDIGIQLINSSEQQIATIEVLKLLSNWSSNLLDIVMAMFTGVIVVITISREVFKHAKISDTYIFDENNAKNSQVSYDDKRIHEEEIKSRMV